MEENMMDSFSFVESSNLSSVATKGDDLFVEFKNGSVYRYPGLAGEFDDLTLADSVGKYFIQNIRNETNTKVTDLDELFYD